jgi:GxxExxY protein
MESDSITQAIIGAAIQVHTELGPGLLESTYEVCLAYELASRGLDALRPPTRASIWTAATG